MPYSHSWMIFRNVMDKQRGTGFIEILVSLSLISLLLLGLDALEWTSLHEMKSAYYFAVAKQQIQVITERLHAFKSSENLESKIIIWNRQNQAVLPHGKGRVTGSYPHYDIA